MATTSGRKATTTAKKAASDTAKTARKAVSETATAAQQAADEAGATARKVIDEAGKTQERVARDVQAAGDRVRDLNEQIFDNIKKQGTAALDAYESALERLLDFQKKMADASQLEWVSALADAQIGFVTSVSQAYTSAVREMLK